MSDDSNWETISSLLHTIALIREAAGINEKPMLSELPDAIRKLRKERDEARREVCQMVSDADESSKPESAKQVANRRGWDCFKENTND